MKRSFKSRPMAHLNFAFLLLFVSAAPLGATTTFDWPTNGWTAGTPTAGQTDTQSFTSVTPNDVTVSVNNSGNGAQGMNLVANYPQISASPATGGLTGTNGFELYVSSSQAAGAYLRTTVSFATPVASLSFQLWDIDKAAGQFVDKISNIQALAQGGGTVGADSVTSAVSGYNSITGTGLTTVVLGTAGANNATNQGTITVVFNGPITQFSFDWSNNDAGLGQQAVALGPLTYTPVPEIGAQWSGLGACAAVIGLEFVRYRRQRRSHRKR